MKKKFICLFLSLSLFGLSGCTGNYIAAFNDNFNGEYKLAAEPPADYAENFEYMDGFGCYSLISRDGETEHDGLTEYRISGYPDCLSDYKVTEFKTKDPKYELFGFSVGDSMTKGKDALSNYGYKIQQTETTGWGFSYQRGKIGIRIFGTDTVTMIWVQLESTNIKGVIF